MFNVEYLILVVFHGFFEFVDFAEDHFLVMSGMRYLIVILICIGDVDLRLSLVVDHILSSSADDNRISPYSVMLLRLIASRFHLLYIIVMHNLLLSAMPSLCCHIGDDMCDTVTIEYCTHCLIVLTPSRLNCLVYSNSNAL